MSQITSKPCEKTVFETPIETNQISQFEYEAPVFQNPIPELIPYDNVSFFTDFTGEF